MKTRPVAAVPIARMDLLAALLQLAAFVMLGLGLALPKLRLTAIAALLVAAGVGLADGLLGPAERTLETVHHYAGYAGNDLEVSMVAFPTGTATAPGWQWPLPFVGFAALWSIVLWSRGRQQLRGPFVLPLLYAWSATATWLWMQLLAAPSAVIQPAGLDRFLWPACLALALLLARQVSGILMLIVMVSAAMLAARLPAALFSKLASDNGLGTVLDVSAVGTKATSAAGEIVNPLNQMVFDPRFSAGSSDQQFWLIWLLHLIIFPAIYTLSLFGIALGVHLWHVHGGDPE
ncbi:MAG: hypothetical protein KDE27_16890 [Planctomycetes bacterium]|nr:hypothetical protein [Planctomycetota bacterium]